MEYINYISEDKATYSYKAIRECVEAVKKFKWQAPEKKSDFWNVEIELELLYRFLYNKTNCILFKPDEDNYYFYNFYRSVCVFKDCTRKELASGLKENERFIKDQLRHIFRMMEYKEVNTIE